VVQDGVQGVTLDTLVFALKNDPRSANVPLVVVTKEPDSVKALYGDKVAFLTAFESAAKRAVEAGVLLPRDAAAVVAEPRDSWPG